MPGYYDDTPRNEAMPTRPNPVSGGNPSIWHPPGGNTAQPPLLDPVALRDPPLAMPEPVIRSFVPVLPAMHAPLVPPVQNTNTTPVAGRTQPLGTTRANAILNVQSTGRHTQEPSTETLVVVDAAPKPKVKRSWIKRGFDTMKTKVQSVFSN